MLSCVFLYLYFTTRVLSFSDSKSVCAQIQKAYASAVCQNSHKTLEMNMLNDDDERLVTIDHNIYHMSYSNSVHM